jgi:hypothetical protein
MTLFLLIVLLIVVCFMITTIIALTNGQDITSFELVVSHFITIRGKFTRKKADEARNDTGLKQKKK